MNFSAMRWSSSLVALAVSSALGACSPRPAPTDTGTQDSQSPPADVAVADSGAEDTAVTDVVMATDSSDVASSDVASAVDVTSSDVMSEGGEAGAPFVPPDFTLQDLNPNSMTHRMDVSPRAMRGRITAWYFGTAT